MLSNTTKLLTGSLFLAAASAPGIASAVSSTGQINYIWGYTTGMYVGVKPESSYGVVQNYYCWFPNSFVQMGNAAAGALSVGDYVSMGCKNTSWSGSSPNYYGGEASYLHVYKGL